MISKSIPAHSFYYTCRYILNKSGAELLTAEGVRGYDYKLMAEDFQMQQQLRPEKKVACFHSILSFYPGEKPSDKTMAEIGQKYLTELGIVNTQYAITKHTDKAHLHLHIVANMVNNEGKSISDSWIGFQGKKIAQKLTQAYDLTPALEKSQRLINPEIGNLLEANRVKMYMVISENLPLCQTIEDLENKLKKKGIEVKYKYKGKTNEKQGISFRLGEHTFKGSQVDRKYSLTGLERILTSQQKQTLLTEKKSSEKLATHHLKPTKQMGNRAISTHETEESIEQKIVQGIGKAVEILMKPEFSQENVPHEFSEKALRKKRKGLSRGL
ncbi:MAG: relaxase/mobilization nuclease domain-containing protein [Bacteroidetes bacterium]|nr:relaxase/mobilization nuclease domain-containing protein [Bacteroidota bacterium]